jgi:hypothetical protein
VFSFLLNQNFVSNKTLLFLKVALLLSFLSVTTAGCSSFTAGVDRSEQGNQDLTVSHPSTEPDPHTSSPVSSFNVTPTVNATSVDIEDVKIPEQTPFVVQPFSSFHVSRAGNNTDGRSWDTAWNELDQIRWEKVNPGDTILIDGGEY